MRLACHPDPASGLMASTWHSCCRWRPLCWYGLFGGSRRSLHGCWPSGHGRVTEGPAVSLNAREQQALDSIKDRLARADPGLQRSLATFTRMASGEQMPGHEDIPPGSWWGIRHARGLRRRSSRRQIHRRFGRMRQNLGIGWVMPLVWLVITALMVTVALTLNDGGSRQTCTNPLSAAPLSAPACPSPSSGHGSLAPRKTAPASTSSPAVSDPYGG